MLNWNKLLVTCTALEIQQIALKNPPRREETAIIFAVKYTQRLALFLKILQFWLELHKDDHPGQFKRICAELYQHARVRQDGVGEAISAILEARSAAEIYGRLVEAGACV